MQGVEGRGKLDDQSCQSTLTKSWSEKPERRPRPGGDRGQSSFNPSIYPKCPCYPPPQQCEAHTVPALPQAFASSVFPASFAGHALLLLCELLFILRA